MPIPVKNINRLLARFDRAERCWHRQNRPDEDSPDDEFAAVARLMAEMLTDIVDNVKDTEEEERKETPKKIKQADPKRGHWTRDSAVRLLHQNPDMFDFESMNEMISMAVEEFNGWVDVPDARTSQLLFCARRLAELLLGKDAIIEGLGLHHIFVTQHIVAKLRSLPEYEQAKSGQIDPSTLMARNPDLFKVIMHMAKVIDMQCQWFSVFKVEVVERPFFGAKTEAVLRSSFDGRHYRIS